MNKDKQVFWYDDGGKLTNLLIVLILIIIILSQSFAINNELSAMDIFSNVLNHNSIYLIMLLYFAFLKTPMGKKYFNYMNFILIFIYFIMFITSLLSIFHGFSLNNLLNVVLNFVIFIYLFHVFLRETRIWDDFRLNSSPFNELTNEWFYSTVVIVSVVLLSVNLILTTTLDGTLLTLLDSFYIIMFSRYVYLYRDYLDNKSRKLLEAPSDVAVLETEVKEESDSKKKKRRPKKEKGDD